MKKNYCNDTYENLPVWSGVLVFEGAGEVEEAGEVGEFEEVGELGEVGEVGEGGKVGEVGEEEEGGNGMGGRDQLLLRKILVTISILESENLTVFLRAIFFGTIRNLS